MVMPNSGLKTGKVHPVYKGEPTKTEFIPPYRGESTKTELIPPYKGPSRL